MLLALSENVENSFTIRQKELQIYFVVLRELKLPQILGNLLKMIKKESRQKREEGVVGKIKY
jgi:hypothetical protein